jgi:hypothetical protein
MRWKERAARRNAGWSIWAAELEKQREHPWRVGSMLNNQPFNPALWCRQYDGHADAASRLHIQSKADNPRTSHGCHTWMTLCLCWTRGLQLGWMRLLCRYK